MKRKLLFLAFIPLLLSISCKNKFDFDRFEGVDATGEWGIPLINVQYSINNILNQLNNNNFISQTEDGNLYLSHESDEYMIADAAEFMTFSGQTKTANYIIPNTFSIIEVAEFEISEAIGLENEDAILKKGEIKEGKLKLTGTHDINANTITLTVMLPEFRTPNNEVFQFEETFNGGNRTIAQNIDLQGLTFTPTVENSTTVILLFQFHQSSQTPQETFNVNLYYELEDITFDSFYGQISEYTMPLSNSFDFNLFSNNYGGSLTVYNPQLYMLVKNSFYVTGEMRIDTASFYGAQGESSILASTPEIISIPVSPLNWQRKDIDNLSAIHIRTDYNSTKIGGKTVLNPGGFGAGDVFINSQSKIQGKFGVTVPYSLSSERIYYNDTISFSIDSLGTPKLVEEILQEAAFRIAITNMLPLNMEMQVYFYNSQTQQILDSLFYNSFRLPGMISSEAQPVEQIATPVVTFDRIDNVTQSDRLIIRFKMDTNGERVNLNARNNVKMKIGVKLKYDTSGVNLSSMFDKK
ncbi:MAG: hypothetical protein LBV02_06000 [Bacteroidales bacterium]|jgi:hypothetical protein|nr:hypothetical protein [Bacteroidales bacterium]